jgi:hypothetical protein
MSICRVTALLALSTLPSVLAAQRLPGRPIGKVTTIGNLIHLQLDSGAIAPERLFDLDHRTLRFTPDRGGYRVENVPVVWDADFGPALTSGQATLKNFSFPFSGRNWDTLNVATGSITFGGMQGGRGGGRGGGLPVGNRTGAGGSARSGFQMERYAIMQTVGRTFINMVPGIAAFTRVGLNGQRYMKELADRTVVTWTLSEGAGGIQAFSWTPTVNRIQAVLHKNGIIELSYNDVNAKDAVVGVFPMVPAGMPVTAANDAAAVVGKEPVAGVAPTTTGGVEKKLSEVALDERPASAPNLNLKKVTVSSVDGLFLKTTFETRGAVLPDGDPGINGVSYRVAFFKSDTPSRDFSKADVVWTIRGVAGGRGFGGGRGDASPRYIASGSGADAQVTVAGNTISLKGILPAELSGAKQLSWGVDVTGGNPSAMVDGVLVKSLRLTDIHSPEVDLSALTKNDGPFPVVYEGFHWPEIPRATDVACSVISALGDKFDFIVSYSDFRVDNPEGGTPSTGPRGGNVSGVGTSTNNLESYCSKGQLQWMYAQPVSMAAVQSQERSPDGRMADYNYAMSQVGHELGHRWAANASALVNGETIVLGPTHWAAGVHLPAAFTYSNPQESDAMGGSTWKDNGDGTWTQLDRDYYSPAKGWSWFALYLMGLAKPEEVQPFFVLRNLERTGQTDAAGHPIYRGTKTAITIQDVIAAMGPRVPDFDHSQKAFNTAMVVVTMPGKQPSKELITAANNIAEHWVVYWSKTTGGRSTMTVSPR